VLVSFTNADGRGEAGAGYPGEDGQKEWLVFHTPLYSLCSERTTRGSHGSCPSLERDEVVCPASHGGGTAEEWLIFLFSVAAFIEALLYAHH
jgi:hypothetical protein